MRSLLTYISTLCLALMILPCSAQQLSAEQQRKVIAAIEKQIAEGEKQLTTIRKQKSTVQNRVQSLAQQVEQRNRLLSAQREQITILSQEIDQIALNSTTLNAQLEHEHQAYAQMVREAYRNYRNNNFVSYIFASRDFHDVARRIVSIRRVAQLRSQKISTIDSLSASLDSARTQLLERKASLDSTVIDITRQREKIQKDVKSARADLSSMSSKERNALQSKALQQEKLDSAIAELRKLTKGNTQGASFTTKTSNLNLPVSGGRVKRYMDNMAEVVGKEGSAVISIYEGKVVDVKQNRITGKYDVYIAHGEHISSYAGLKNAWVAKGENVARNQKIGQVGAAVDIITMNTEYKIVFGIYPPSPNQKMKAADCFKK